MAFVQRVLTTFGGYNQLYGEQVELFSSSERRGQF